MDVVEDGRVVDECAVDEDLLDGEQGFLIGLLLFLAR